VGPLEFRFVRQPVGHAGFARDSGAQQPDHFKFGDTKSVFYLTETDLDISPTGRERRLEDSHVPPGRRARTGRRRAGSFSLKGRWYTAPERLDLDLYVDRANLGEVTALLRGQEGGSTQHHVAAAPGRSAEQYRNHGTAGYRRRTPLGSDANQGQGWPLDIRGRLDLMAQQAELHSNTAGSTTLPLSVHFRATGYLSATALGPWRSTGTGFPPRRCLSWRCTWERRCRPNFSSAAPWMGRSAIRGRAVFRANWRFTMRR